MSSDWLWRRLWRTLLRFSRKTHRNRRSRCCRQRCISRLVLNRSSRDGRLGLSRNRRLDDCRRLGIGGWLRCGLRRCNKRRQSSSCLNFRFYGSCCGRHLGQSRRRCRLRNGLGCRLRFRACRRRHRGWHSCFRRARRSANATGRRCDGSCLCWLPGRFWSRLQVWLRRQLRFCGSCNRLNRFGDIHSRLSSRHYGARSSRSCVRRDSSRLLSRTLLRTRDASRARLQLRICRLGNRGRNCRRLGGGSGRSSRRLRRGLGIVSLRRRFRDIIAHWNRQLSSGCSWLRVNDRGGCSMSSDWLWRRLWRTLLRFSRKTHRNRRSRCCRQRCISRLVLNRSSRDGRLGLSRNRRLDDCRRLGIGGWLRCGLRRCNKRRQSSSCLNFRFYGSCCGRHLGQSRRRCRLRNGLGCRLRFRACRRRHRGWHSCFRRARRSANATGRRCDGSCLCWLPGRFWSRLQVWLRRQLRFCGSCNRLNRFGDIHSRLSSRHYGARSSRSCVRRDSSRLLSRTLLRARDASRARLQLRPQLRCCGGGGALLRSFASSGRARRLCVRGLLWRDLHGRGSRRALAWLGSCSAALRRRPLRRREGGRPRPLRCALRRSLERSHLAGLLRRGCARGGAARSRQRRLFGGSGSGGRRCCTRCSRRAFPRHRLWRGALGCVSFRTRIGPGGGRSSCSLRNVRSASSWHLRCGSRRVSSDRRLDCGSCRWLRLALARLRRCLSGHNRRRHGSSCSRGACASGGCAAARLLRSSGDRSSGG